MYIAQSNSVGLSNQNNVRDTIPQWMSQFAENIDQKKINVKTASLFDQKQVQKCECINCGAALNKSENLICDHCIKNGALI